MWCHSSLSPPLRVCASVFLPPLSSTAPPCLCHLLLLLLPSSFSLPFCLSSSFSIFQFIRALLSTFKIIHWHGSNNAVMGWRFCHVSFPVQVFDALICTWVLYGFLVRNNKMHCWVCIYSMSLVALLSPFFTRPSCQAPIKTVLS